MTTSFLKNIVKEIDNDYAGLLSEGGVGDIESFVDTGSYICLLYTSPSPRDYPGSRMPSSA